jgi:hypothetical protein
MAARAAEAVLRPLHDLLEQEHEADEQKSLVVVVAVAAAVLSMVL